MLKIRLTRRGKKNKAFFRLVVAEHTSPIKGKFLEALGFLNPHTKEKALKEERIKYWIGKGAQCSGSVHNLLVGAKIISGPKRAVKMKKKEAEEIKEGEKPSEEKKEETPKPEEKTEEKPKKEEKKEEDSKPSEKKENDKEPEKGAKEERESEEKKPEESGK
ncbi:MAG: 30S ribosomal protein S16 [Parcubacteria group bacterium]|jgi:small subunit ribosomal protein S16